MYLLGEEEQMWVQRLSEPDKWEELAKNLNQRADDNTFLPPLSLEKPSETFEAYALKIKKAQEMIRAGNIYQINLSQQFLFNGYRDAFRIFQKLALENPSPFSAYLKLKEQNHRLLFTRTVFIQEGYLVRILPHQRDSPQRKNCRGRQNPIR